MKKTSLFFILLFCGGLFFFSQVQAQEVRYGNLSQLISQIRSAMPGQNSYAFVVPTTAQMDSFGTTVHHILQEDYSVADSLARHMNYILYEWYDTAWDSTRYYILMEPDAMFSWGVHLGWGTFIFYPEGDDEIIIEVPHPYFDTNTWQVGFATYQYLENRYFLMAGTHRYANGTNPRPADVAHNNENMFHVVHEEVSPLSRHAMQIHGFSRNNHPGYPDVILSNGTPVPGMILDSLAQEIIAEGFTVGIFDGINWTALGATTNTQGLFSNANGYSFIHMELEYFIRSNASNWENIVDVLYRVFYVPSGITNLSQGQYPEQLVLYPNYPNPFNSSTTIRYFLGRPGRASIVIYNGLAQKVKILQQKHQAGGLYQISWDGKNEEGNAVPSGLYWLVIDNGSEQHAQKMLLVK